ncbi:ABC transporter ATP-binding protein [Saccharibacillus sp. CPCC 101409]|uniref:ABC transporter ATP-binding protein n=1 Tax=Saccharibacillus sp. CPCC 101409 TaxID=3058041 RepID=UPI0026722A66|nr:ABC transporter ATP-binding protein [Saccharibacillus sp. CPCC 101409]MDO3411090.1 ABC transporter ATP-binding protein [Saccharibacillus sp. CPCC 101409]
MKKAAMDIAIEIEPGLETKRGKEAGREAKTKAGEPHGAAPDADAQTQSGYPDGTTPAGTIDREAEGEARRQPPEAAASEEYAAEVRALRLKFPGTQQLLFRDLSLEIRRGEKVLLLGPSGCGKSTLLQVLGGVIPRVTEVPLKAERLTVPDSAGLVFQDPDTQFCMSYVDEELAFVLENLAVPRGEMDARIEAALREVGLDLPDRHMPIGDLSQGMKQRLALASVLLLEPDALLLDEPSALLDPEGRRTIWEAVRRVSARRTVIIVEHRIEEVLHWVDRIVLLRSDGSILADGAPAGLFGRYRAELREYGVWYPGAWDDAYGGAEAGAADLAAENARRGAPADGEAESPAGTQRPGGEANAPRMAARPAGRAAPGGGEARGEAPAAGAPLLRLRDFRVRRGGRTVCAAEAAEVLPGDLIALVGPNGAGKSSLLLGLMGLLAHEGVCEFGGIAPAGRRAARETAAKHAAFVFQNPEFQFVTNRALDEVAFTLRSEAERALRAGRRPLLGRRPKPDAAAESGMLRRSRGELARFGLAGFEDRHPYLLSLGQKRRLSVASAVVSDKPLLLLDEPTFGQDARNAFAILDLCERLRASGHAVLMVTHELEIADRLATQIWRIEGGRLVSAEHTGRSRSGGAFVSLVSKEGTE